MRLELQFTDKELEDMTLEELRTERRIHTWAGRKWRSVAFASNRRLHWLEENKPLAESKDDIKKQYEEGLLNTQQYATKMHQWVYLDRNYRSAVMEIEYAKDLQLKEEATCRAIDEEIERAKNHRERKRGRKHVDMTERAGRNNPKAGWRKMHQNLKLQKKLKGHSQYWQMIEAKNKSAAVALERRRPIVNWDFSKLEAAAKSIGYASKDAVYAAVAQELELSIGSTRKLLQAGVLSWGQAILIGALFEMTPAMFCDTFLSGYFKEIADGRFIAQVDDKEPLRGDSLPLRRPVKDKDDE